MSVTFLQKAFFKIKLSFLLGGMVVGTTCVKMVEDCRPGSKKSATFQMSEASSATTIHMGSVLVKYLVGNLTWVPPFGGIYGTG